MNDMTVIADGVALEAPKPRHPAISATEAALLDMPGVDVPIAHYFGPGIYIREMSARAGLLLIGHYHRGPCMNVLVKGSMRVVGPDGIATTISAPMIFNTGPGRKVGLMLEDVVFQNIWATDETDIDALETMLIDASDDWRNTDTQDHFDLLLSDAKE